MILLDTHVLVRYLMGDKKLGRRAVATIDKALPIDEVYVSAISFWEVAMLVERKRLELDMTVTAFRTLVLRHGIREEALDGEIGIAAAELPGTHGDPADRMLVATAVLRGLTLVTADDVLLRWKLRGFRAQDATA
ncbi:MAG TPA: type II toxin-antitoxin system VapC family toxin [Kofleriaceae bacterium]|nr:type II toxin-antitoxin system VapC family toxin [Kofleriaceae bacterium]